MRRVLDRELISRSADAFIAVSDYGARRMVEVERIPRERIVVVSNGVVSRAPGDGRRFRAELGIPPDAVVVGALGHIRKEKAYDVLVRAAVGLRNRHPGLRVVIVGSDYDPAVARLVAELDLQDTVLMPGARHDIADVVAAFDVAVNCSASEGQPLSLLELMDARRPLVATRVGGVPEIVQDGVTGLLVEPGRPEALAGAIESLLADPVRAAEMVERAAERRAREFDVDAVVPRFERLYEELLARKRPGR